MRHLHWRRSVSLRQSSFGFGVALLAASCDDYTCLDLANCASSVVEAGVGTLSAPSGEVITSTLEGESGVDESTDSSRPSTDALDTDQSTNIPTEPSATLAPPSSETPTTGASTTEASTTVATASEPSPLPGPDSGPSVEHDAGETPVCVVDETTCTEGNQLQRCGAAGQWGEPIDCPFVCVDGQCAGECVPEDEACNESAQVVACDADGNWNVVQSCAALCEDGECVDECTSDSYSCAGDVLSRCQSGALVPQETCSFLCDPNAGACVGECEPNDTLCIDGQLATCGADALFGAGVECANVCLGTSCGGECKPDATRCKSSQIQQTCTDEGQWDDGACEFVCVDDACGGVCIPGARRCLSNGVPSASGSQSQLCDESGQWTAITTCVESCQNTQCTGLCEPGSPNECVVDDGEPALRVCSDGQWVTQSCDYVCSAGACSGVCEPGAARCNAGARETCSAAGAWGGASCSAGQVCQGEGQCLAKPTVATLTATGTALQTGRVDGKTGVAVAAGASTTLSWTLSGGSPTSITLAPAASTDIAAGATSVSVTPTKTQDYVLTATNAAGSSSKTITLAVVSSGTKKFIRHFGSSGDDSVAGLAMDAQGRVLTVGFTLGSYTVGGVTASSQVFVAVHDPATGNVTKIKPLATSDLSNGHTIAADGNDLLVGGAIGQAQGLLRLGSNLAINDTVSFQLDNPLGEGDYQIVLDLAIDAQRNVLVGGSSWSLDGSTVVTLNTAFNGRQETSIASVSTASAAVAFDRSGRIVVAGKEYLRRYSNGVEDTATIGVLPTGVSVMDLAIDHVGNIVVAGTNASGAYVAKIADDLHTISWSKTFTGGGTGVCVDEADNVILLARNGSDLLLRAYTPSGATLWNSLTVSGVSATFDIVCDSAGNVFAIGVSPGQVVGSSGYSGGVDGTMVKLQ